MDAGISSVVEPVVESLMVHVKKHLGFIVSSTKHVKDMEEEMNQLNRTEQDIQQKKTTAEANYHVVSRHVSPWLEDVEKMKEKVQSVPTAGIGCFNVAKRYKAGKQSCVLVEQIKALKVRASEISWTNERRPLAKVPSTSVPVPHGTPTTFESRDSVFNAALQSLQSNNESEKMIALCGMGGIGKTTMMEQLKKAVEDSKMFGWVVKVVLGESTDPFALQQAVAEYIHQDLTEKTKEARAELLRKKFEGMSQNGQKKILVIMDDLWKEVDLNDVGLTSPLPNGFKLLLTSRFEYVCTQMGVRPNSIFRVPFLNDVEAKTLFFEIVGITPSDGDDDEFQKIGEDIVKKCGGLPIALKTIAKSLIGNIKEAWEQTLFNLQHDDLQDLNYTLNKIFEMSYNNLKTEDDKSIFLLSGLFPDDFDIPIEDLMRYGWGLKLFTKVDTLREARRRTIISVNNLMQANLLTESECMGCVKMHDLVRVFALSNFTKVKQASIVYQDNISGHQLTEDAKESYERLLLSFTGNSKFPIDFSYPNLSLLVIMDGGNLLKFPQDIFANSEKLEVVCCENMGIPLLPTMFEHSIKLRTLCLRSCSLIDDISFLGSLSNLEALSFVDCGIRRLPSMIGMLKKLKLLDLTGCVDLSVDDGVFQNLEHLEELCMRADEDSPVRFTDANCDELEILSRGLFALELEFYENKAQPQNMSFEKLERFRISIGCQLNTPEDNEEYIFRNTIQFIGECNELVECKINNLFEKTEELHLQVNAMKCLENVSMDHSFTNLKFLYVSDCKELTYLFTVAVASGLRKLELLKISNCPVMRTLVGEDCTNRVIRFRKLKFMYLKGLTNMVSLCGTMIELPELVELYLNTLPKFTSIYLDDSNQCAIQPLLNKKVVIPKLETLYICGMDNLKQIWPCQISTSEKNKVSMLRKIKVKTCDSLINIFPNNPFPMLNNLEKLEVEHCGSIKVIFNIDFENVNEMEGYISRLRSIRVYRLWNLTELWRIRGVNNSNILINGFQGVESIYITDCKRFKDIYTPVTANFDLRALTTYSAIWNYGISEVDDIPDVTYPSYFLHTWHHLQRLVLVGVERVEVVFDMDSQSSRQLATTQLPLLLPYLESIDLHGLEMSHVWKCNWNKFLIRHHPPLQFPFHNLTHISFYDCPNIKYLFSPLMAKYLSNLKSVYIKDCNSIEEVISSRDDENEKNTTSTSSYQDTTFFPHLDTLNLDYLPCLKSVDDGDMRCRSDKLSSNIITNAIHDEFQSGRVIGAYWSLCHYPIVVVPQLSNLKSVCIHKCDHLPHIFTFSSLESLNQLKHLEVTKCKAMQVIVKEEHEMSSKVVTLPSLETLELKDLPNLKGFFLGMNDFRWPSLDKVLINDCPALKMFTSGRSTTPKLKYIQTSSCKYSPECGLNFHGTISQTIFPPPDPTISKGMPFSFHNLIEINYIQKEDVGKTFIPSHALLQLQKLQQIAIKYCRRVEEVFEVVASEGSGSSKSHTVLKIPNLTQVNLRSLHGLKCLWKSNKWMVLEFPNLTTLYITCCHNLEHVFTCSMVGSLVQLQDLHISCCKNIKVIVKQEEEEEECDAKVNEIMLPCLNSLELDRLPSLKGFCLGKEAFSFPRLEILKIKKCPTIAVFTKEHVSTPELKAIYTGSGISYLKTDINSFLKTKQEEQLLMRMRMEIGMMRMRIPLIRDANIYKNLSNP